MTISFNQVPSQLRVPLFYAEFDNTRAVQGSATQLYNVLMIGNRLAAGTKAALSISVVTSAEQAADYFGAGSVLAEMAAKYLALNKINQLTCVPLDDPSGGVKATGAVTFSGTPTKAGTISFMIGGRNIQIGVATTDTPDSLATALAAAITADTFCMVDGAVDGMVTSKVNLTFNHKGLIGNEMDVRHSYFDGEALPAGVTVAITAMSGGTSQPDVDTVWPVLGDKQYILMVTPYTDSSSLGKMETELTGRFGPLQQNDGYGIYGKRATFGNLITLGGTKNSQFTSIMGISGPSNPWAWAGAEAAQVAASASIDPARPFQTLPLSGIYAPSQAEKFDLNERNQLLFAGIATFFVDAGGVVNLEGVITTYQKNSFSSPDQSYLYLNTLLTLSFIRFDLKARITSRFPRHKLANDGTRFSPGQAVVTPNSIKAEVITKFQEWESNALVEGFSQFKNDLIVERDSANPNRVNILLPPDLVNQLVIVGTKIQFLL